MLPSGLGMQEGKTFRVVVVDSRPHYEGRVMLSKLLSCGIPCTYLHLHALCFTMQARHQMILPQRLRGLPGFC